MSGLMEELIAEERAEVREEVREEAAAEKRKNSIATAQILLEDGFYSHERVAEITKLSLKEVETLANGLPVN